MTERRCAVVGCDAFPDAAWSLCAAHLAQIEAEVDADYADQKPGDPS
jgi:anaerobic glycerol-3-phosphate dehydrogenase